VVGATLCEGFLVLGRVRAAHTPVLRLAYSGDFEVFHPKGDLLHQNCELCEIWWIRIPPGMEAGLGLGHIVLDGDPAASGRGTAAPTFRPMSTVAKRPPFSATIELELCLCFVHHAFEW